RSGRDRWRRGRRGSAPGEGSAATRPDTPKTFAETEKPSSQRKVLPPDGGPSRSLGTFFLPAEREWRRGGRLGGRGAGDPRHRRDGARRPFGRRIQNSGGDPAKDRAGQALSLPGPPAGDRGLRASELLHRAFRRGLGTHPFGLQRFQGAGRGGPGHGLAGGTASLLPGPDRDFVEIYSGGELSVGGSPGSCLDL